MSLELLDKPDNILAEEKKFPFKTETKTVSEYQALFSKAKKSGLIKEIVDGSNVEKSMSDFFDRNQKANEIVYSLPCEGKYISAARRHSMDFLENRLHLSMEEMSSLHTLVGEILNDTDHSIKQKFHNPEFTIKLNVSKFGGYSFEIINQDRIEFDKWPIAYSGEEAVAAHREDDPHGHVGTPMKILMLEKLKGNARYIAIINEEGEKEFTSFCFEKKQY